MKNKQEGIEKETIESKKERRSYQNRPRARGESVNKILKKEEIKLTTYQIVFMEDSFYGIL